MSKNITLNAADFISPGIYDIYCKYTNKHYIGEAVNVLERLGKHSRNLLSNIDDNKELQKDWNLYGPEQFLITVLFCGPEWSSKDDRLEKETEIVNSYPHNEIYNVIGDALVRSENYRVVCEIHGVRYKSIAEASRLTGENERLIRIKLNNKHENYVVIELVKHGYEPIIANGKQYDSIIAAVEAGEANNRSAAFRLLQNKRRLDWNYINPEKHIDKSSLNNSENSESE